MGFNYRMCVEFLWIVSGKYDWLRECHFPLYHFLDSCKKTGIVSSLIIISPEFFFAIVQPRTLFLSTHTNSVLWNKGTTEVSPVQCSPLLGSPKERVAYLRPQTSQCCCAAQSLPGPWQYRNRSLSQPPWQSWRVRYSRLLLWWGLDCWSVPCTKHNWWEESPKPGIEG